MAVEIRTQWTSTAPLPDEKHLQDLWKARIASRERHYAQVAALREWRKKHRPLMSELLGLSKEEISLACKDSATLAAQTWADVRPQLVVATVNYVEMEGHQIWIAETNAEAQEPEQGPPWSGTITESAGAGFWQDHSSGPEVASPKAILYHGGPDRLGLHAETLSDDQGEEYYAEINAYMKFEMTPPSWGSLVIDAQPWLHGFYHAFADEQGYDAAHVVIEVDAWVDLHQNFWRTRVHDNVFALNEWRLPPQSDRIDTQALLQPVFNVGEGDLVTIRVGVRLCCQTKASWYAPLSAHAVLDFMEGEANYVSVPYLQWTLTQ